MTQQEALQKLYRLMDEHSQPPFTKALIAEVLGHYHELDVDVFLTRLTSGGYQVYEFSPSLDWEEGPFADTKMAVALAGELLARPSLCQHSLLAQLKGVPLG